MYTIIDSWRISTEVAEILAFHGIATEQTVERVGEKNRYRVEIKDSKDNDRAEALFPLRKWEHTMAETLSSIALAFQPQNINQEAYRQLWAELDKCSRSRV